MAYHRFVLLCLFALGCGVGPKGSSFISAEAKAIESLRVDVAVGFARELAAPLVVNGRVSNTGEMATCISAVSINFDQAVAIATVAGSLTATTAAGGSEGFALESINEEGTVLSFRHFAPHLCTGVNAPKALVFHPGVRTIEGAVTVDERIVSIPLPTSPANSGSLPGDFRASLELPLQQSINLGQSNFSVAPGQLNEAFYSEKNWQKSEVHQSYYASRSLLQLPLTGSILAPFNPINRANQFGAPDTVYVLRRAAAFVSALFPSLRQIQIADLSTSTGNTPSVALGNQSILLHPPGSHVGGVDADIGYVNLVNGSDEVSSLDWEKNFWLVYALLQSTEVDLIMTAHKEKFAALAHEAFDRGLINAIAVGRFDSPRLQLNEGFNHEKHLHVSMRNRDNDSITRRFSSADDVYSCYILLKPNNRGSGGNYCGTDD